MRLWILAIVALGIGAAAIGCAQQSPAPPKTIGEWMKMDQVHP